MNRAPIDGSSHTPVAVQILGRDKKATQETEDEMWRRYPYMFESADLWVIMFYFMSLHLCTCLWCHRVYMFACWPNVDYALARLCDLIA